MKKSLLVFCSLFSFLFSFSQADKNFQVQSFKEELYSDQVSVFVKADKNALVDYLKEHEGKYKYFSGGYHGITIGSKYLKNLLSQTFIKGSDFTLHRPSVLNDTMRVRDNVNPVHAGVNPLDTSYTGKGVLVGIIDTGLELNHDDFKDANGNTRVLRIWDQTMSFDIQRTPAFYGYGQVWDSADINASICPQVDGGNGHGTTVSGTAVGNGSATGFHKGVAPNANIIIVKSNFNVASWLPTVADAVDYIYKVADSLKMPCVINASLGDYLGSHDGTDPSALFIDSLIDAKPGRLMICAAGNSGNIGNYHLRHDGIPLDTNFTWFQYNSGSTLGYGAVFFEGYIDTNAVDDFYYAMGANLPSGSFAERGRTSFVNLASHAGNVYSEEIINNGNIIGSVDFYAELQGAVYLLQVHVQEPDSNNYNFSFMTTGTGAIDIWSTSAFGYSPMVNSGLPNSTTLPEIVNYVSPDSSKIIVSSFTCGRNTIAVGNYYGMTTYLDVNGNTQSVTGTNGFISVNSSRGPSRDLRVKPEISASGDIHLSSAPLDMIAWMLINEPHKVAQGGMHIRNGGTSMASPVVTGIAALALEKCSRLTAAEFRDMITSTAKTDVFTGVVPNMSYGYGKVDALATMILTNFPEPVANSFSPICANDSSEITLTQSYDTYDWSDGTSGSSLWAKDSIYYNVTVTDQFGCKESLDSIRPSMYTANSITITLDAGNQLLLSSATLTYQWMFEGDSLIGETSSQLDYTTTGEGNYQVLGTDGNGCLMTGTYFLDFTGIEENNSEGISIFPNPTNGIIQISSKENKLLSIKLSDATGKTISFIQNPNEIITMDIKNLARGIYFIEAETENGKLVKRVIRD